jgi:hypothetical protein
LEDDIAVGVGLKSGNQTPGKQGHPGQHAELALNLKPVSGPNKGAKLVNMTASSACGGVSQRLPARKTNQNATA